MSRFLIAAGCALSLLAACSKSEDAPPQAEQAAAPAPTAPETAAAPAAPAPAAPAPAPAARADAGGSAAWPASGKHTVAPGETLESVARRYGVQPADLADWNGLEAGAKVQPGQELLLSAQGS